MDASKIDEIADAAKGMDVIIDLVTPVFYINVMKAALKANAHYVNTAWEEYLFEGFEENDVKLGAKLKMFDDFAKKGLTAILGCGMISGFASNVLVRYYSDKLDTVESIKLRLAKFLDFAVPTYVIRDGEFIRMDEPFAEPELWDFPEPIGRTLVSRHAHEEPFSIPHFLASKGLKYCDFKYYDTFLDGDPAQFEYLDKTKLVSIMIEMKGQKDGKDITYSIHVPSMNTPRQLMYDLYGTSLISAALPAAIGAKMAFEGTEKGVIHPHDLDPNRFIELLRETGYPNQWDETVK